MPHYLVTGGCGFIGSHLCDALVAAGHSVTVLDNLSTGRLENVPSGCRVVVGDVQDRAMVMDAMTEVDGCFHLAAIASVERANREWLATHAANQTGTITVLDVARRSGKDRPVPVVYASSAAVYGNPATVPITESAPQHPTSAYGADKLGCELHARVASAVHGVPTLGLRFFNVYGPRQDPSSPYSGVISIFADRLRRSQGITIHGDGQQVRDFVYVGDVVRHLVAGMAGVSTTAQVLNVCTGVATTVLELAHTLASLLGRQAEIAYAPARPGDIRLSVGSAAEATAALGVRAETALPDGLALLLAPTLASAVLAAPLVAA